jgi:hypothetical protein
MVFRKLVKNVFYLGSRRVPSFFPNFPFALNDMARPDRPWESPPQRRQAALRAASTGGFRRP